MGSTKTTKKDSKADALRRLDNRILVSQFEYIEREMKKLSQGQGEVLRTLLAEAITNRKKK